MSGVHGGFQATAAHSPCLTERFKNQTTSLPARDALHNTRVLAQNRNLDQKWCDPTAPNPLGGQGMPSPRRAVSQCPEKGRLMLFERHLQHLHLSDTWEFRWQWHLTVTALTAPQHHHQHFKGEQSCCCQEQHHTCFFFSFCSKTFCRFFFCFLLRGFFRCCSTRGIFFFFAFFAGRTRALLSSIPFRVAPSEGEIWLFTPARWIIFSTLLSRLIKHQARFSCFKQTKPSCPAKKKKILQHQQGQKTSKLGIQ